jgi:hypothetical protein
VARTAGLRHIVYLSQLNATKNSPVRFLRYHARARRRPRNRLSGLLSVPAVAGRQWLKRGAPLACQDASKRGRGRRRARVRFLPDQRGALWKVTPNDRMRRTSSASIRNELATAMKPYFADLTNSTVSTASDLPSIVT